MAENVSDEGQPIIGFMVDDVAIRPSVAELYQACLRQGGTVRVVLNTFPGAARLSLRRKLVEYGPRRFVDGALYAAAMAVERRLEGRHVRTSCLPASPGDMIPISPLPSQRNMIYRYGPIDLAKLRSARLDLLVRGDGRGILKGDILHVARDGVVSLHYGDNRAYRGGPPGFWEVRRNEPEVGFIVQRLTEELDNGEVLARGAVPKGPSVSDNLERVLAASIPAFEDVLASYRATGRLPNAESRDRTAGPLLSVPSARITLAYALARLAAGRSSLRRE